MSKQSKKQNKEEKKNPYITIIIFFTIPDKPAFKMSSGGQVLWIRVQEDQAQILWPYETQESGTEGKAAFVNP